MGDYYLQKVPTGKKIAYAAPAFALAVVGIPIYIYVPKFYTDVVGVNIATVGSILLAVRIFDAATDPVMGLISDRTKTGLGRRRPYLAGGSVLLGTSIFLLFNPPNWSSASETLWFAVTIFSLFFFWTVVTVPYESLGPEITFDYHERTSLFGLRDGCLLAGTLVAASSPAAVKWAFGLPADAHGEREKFYLISLLYVPLLVVLCWWCVLSIKERPGGRNLKGLGLFDGLRKTCQNRPFIILLAAYTVAAFGSNLPATLILYYVQYVLESVHADLFLMIYFVTGILFLPLWVGLSRRVGKKRSWLTAMAINTGAFVGVFFLGSGDETAYGLLVAVSGVGFGATVAIPSAMQADVIDYDELNTFERREGQYIGLWSITRKLAAAVGVGLSLMIMAAAGYEPNADQPEQVKFTLRVLYALVPCICNGAAFCIALLYPISSEVHEEIRAAIADRKAGRRYSDPLTGVSRRTHDSSG